METVRETWTDQRLDDFAAHTDRRFDQVDRRFDQVDREIHELRSEMNARFETMETRFDGLQRTMFQSSVLVVVALIGLIATQL